jgi:hypothetical protein
LYPREPSRIDASKLDQPDLLGRLVAHRCALSPALLVEAAVATMRHDQVNFAAVVEDGRLLGQIARHRIDEMLGGRFGFALHGRSSIREFVNAPSLAVTLGDPIAEVLTAMNQRQGTAFYDDVMLLDSDGQFLGFIDTRTLVQVQHELFLQQISHLATSTESLNRLNLELAETYKGLVDASRRAGMAEIATGVLHNVGNVLTSLNVSANVIATGLRESKNDRLVRLAAMLRAHEGDLTVFSRRMRKGGASPSSSSRLHDILPRKRRAFSPKPPHFSRTSITSRRSWPCSRPTRRWCRSSSRSIRQR